jgi:hypothetical protein
MQTLGQGPWCEARNDARSCQTVSPTQGRVPARLFVSKHVKSRVAEGDHTVEQQGRTEPVETTAGCLIVSPGTQLMLSFDVACEVAQMERRRSFHQRGFLEIFVVEGEKTCPRSHCQRLRQRKSSFLTKVSPSTVVSGQTETDRPLSCNLHSAV